MHQITTDISKCLQKQRPKYIKYVSSPQFRLSDTDSRRPQVQRTVDCWRVQFRMEPLILFVELSHYGVNSAFVLIGVMLQHSELTAGLMSGRHAAHTALHDDLSSSLKSSTTTELHWE